MGDCLAGDGGPRLPERDGCFAANDTACAGMKRSPVDQVDAATDEKMLRLDVVAEQTRYIEAFSLWNEDEQVELFCLLLSRMSQTQQSRISSRIRLLASHQRGSLLFRSSA